MVAPVVRYKNVNEVSKPSAVLVSLDEFLELIGRYVSVYLLMYLFPFYNKNFTWVLLNVFWVARRLRMNYVIVLFLVLFSKDGKFMFKYAVLNEFSD